MIKKYEYSRGVFNDYNSQKNKVEVALRDNPSNLLFIIDVNPTPTGPSGLNRKEKKYALNLLAETLKPYLN